jgi:hypothetical protein
LQNLDISEPERSRQTRHQSVVETLTEKQHDPHELMAFGIDAHSIQRSRFYTDQRRDRGLFGDQHSAF